MRFDSSSWFSFDFTDVFLLTATEVETVVICPLLDAEVWGLLQGRDDGVICGVGDVIVGMIGASVRNSETNQGGITLK